MIKIKTTFPLLQVASPASAAAFYVEQFGFEPIFESDWYVQIQSGPYELGFIEIGHDSIPADRRRLSGDVCLTMELEGVAAVDAAYAALRDKLKISTPLRDEPFGQRHFLGIDPSGIMLDVTCQLGDPSTTQ